MTAPMPETVRGTPELLLPARGGDTGQGRRDAITHHIRCGFASGVDAACPHQAEEEDLLGPTPGQIIERTFSAATGE